MSRHSCRRCDWQPDTTLEATTKQQLADHADAAGHPRCTVCALSLPDTQPQTCIPCVATVRRQLAEILETYALLPGELGHPTATPPDAQRSGHTDDETSLPGGDVLALLSPGSEGSQWRGRSRVDPLAHTPWRRTQILRSDGKRLLEAEPNDNLEADTPSVAQEVGRWEDTFRASRGLPAATTAATVTGAIGYLNATLTWASDQHPAFAEFAADMRKVHHKLRDVVGASQRPQLGVHCFDCNGDLTREYGQDDYTCSRCRRVYDSASYWLAVRWELQMDTAT